MSLGAEDLSTTKVSGKKVKVWKVVSPAVCALQEILEIAADAAGSSAAPGLQVGLSVLAKILQRIQRAQANVEDANTLKARIEAFTVVLREVSRTPKNISKELLEQIATLFRSWEKIAEDAKTVRQKSLLLRAVNASRDMAKVNNLVRKFSDSIHHFQLRSHVTLLKLAQINADNTTNTVSILSSSAVKDRLAFVAEDAYYDRARRERCLPKTRKNEIKRLQTWAAEPLRAIEPPPFSSDSAADLPPLSSPPSQLLWLTGFLGAGKTTLAATLCHKWQDQNSGILGASFFCSRNTSATRDVRSILPTIAFQLQARSPIFQRSLEKTLQRHPSGVGDDIIKQLQELLIDPLADCSTSLPSLIVVIDALDECEDAQAVSLLLRSMFNELDRLKPLRFLISSRCERRIELCFSEDAPKDSWQVLDLNGAADEDIESYLHSKLTSLRRDYQISGNWPPTESVVELARISSSSFIYAATAVRHIEAAAERDLDPVLSLQTLIASVSITNPSQSLLDYLYLEILNTAFKQVSPRALRQLRRILGTIILLQEPLPAEGLASLIKIETDAVPNQCVTHLRSVLTIPKSSGDDILDKATVWIIHPTFPEFLLSADRCTNPDFVIDAKEHHCMLLQRCLEVAVEATAGKPGNHHSPNAKPFQAPPHVRYAISYWACHFARAEMTDDPHIESLISKLALNLRHKQPRELLAAFSPWRPCEREILQAWRQASKYQTMPGEIRKDFEGIWDKYFAIDGLATKASPRSRKIRHNSVMCEFNIE